MSEASEPRPRRRRRWLLVIAAIAAVALLIAGWAAYDLHRARSIWPESMPALEMPPPVIAVHPESLARLKALTEAAAELEAHHDLRTELLDLDEPPRAPLEGWPPYDPEAERALDAFLATGGLQLPPIVIEAAPDWNFIPLMHVSALRRVRALQRAVDGDPGGAWRDVADVWTLGHRLAHSGAHLLATMVGMAIEEQALGLAERLLAHGPWHAEAAELARGLDAAAGRPSPLIAALTGECLAADGLYQRMGDADAEALSDNATTGALQPAAPGKTRADDTWLYDSEKTRAYARRDCLSTIEAARTPAPQRSEPEPIDLGERHWASVGPLLDNPVGRTLLAIAQPTFGRYITKADRLAYHRRRTRLALARAAYLAAEGQPAADVQALVPTYIAAVPTDPFTGQPMPLEPPPPPEDE